MAREKIGKIVIAEADRLSTLKDKIDLPCLEIAPNMEAS